MKRLKDIKVILFFLVRLAVVLEGLAAVFNKDWTNFVFSILTIIILFMPSFISRKIHLELPNGLEVTIVLFIFAAMFCGEMKSFYIKFWWWDIMLHTLSGFIVGEIGFLLVYKLNKHESVDLNLSPFFVGMFSFCFALAIGAIWEIYEFAMDSIFGFNMQKSGLVDTMTDLIVDAVGALIVSIIGYFCIKKGLKIIKVDKTNTHNKNNNINSGM